MGENLSQPAMNPSLYATDNDGKRYQRTILIITALSFGQLALAIAHIMPFWVMAFTMPILVPRWMSAIHEIFHVRKAEQVDLITRIMPMMFTPFVLSYREYQTIHDGHHKFMCTPDDPELFQLRGGYLSGFLNAMTMPEQALIRWVAKNGMSRQLTFTMAINAILFFGIVYLAGWDFLWYWIPVRVSYTVSTFAFFYMLHRRGADYGVYPVKFPAFVSWLYVIVLGKEALLSTCHHDLHHANPRIAAYSLDEANLLKKY